VNPPIVRMLNDRLERAHDLRDRRMRDAGCWLFALLFAGSFLGWWAACAMPFTIWFARRIVQADNELRAARDEMRDAIAPPAPTPYGHGYVIRARRSAS
jgi:hypothetical protein